MQQKSDRDRDQRHTVPDQRVSASVLNSRELLHNHNRQLRLTTVDRREAVR